MSERPIQVAVVGHTNVGKTSLLRTLARDRSFGEVSSRAATTKEVVSIGLMVDDRMTIEFYDTPGLENSQELYEHIESLTRSERTDWREAIGRFVEDPALHARFPQEAKSLGQVRRADTCLFVVDAREPIRNKYLKEMELLWRAGRPILPVLNFVASPEAQTQGWRHRMAGANLHAVVEFDTVAFDITGELRLFEKLLALAPDPQRAPISALIADRRARWARLRRSTAERVAELLVDAAAARVVPTGRDEAARAAANERLKEEVRGAERRTAQALLADFEFGPDDYLPPGLGVEGSGFRADLFSPDAMKELGLSLGTAIAAGAGLGVTVDLLVGGITLGAAAALGALGGAVVEGAKKLEALKDELGATPPARATDAALLVLAARAIALAEALMRRGHAAQERITLTENPAGKERLQAAARTIVAQLGRARRQPSWYRLAVPPAPLEDAEGRRRLVDGLTRHVEAMLPGAEG